MIIVRSRLVQDLPIFLAESFHACSPRIVVAHQCRDNHLPYAPIACISMLPIDFRFYFQILVRLLVDISSEIRVGTKLVGNPLGGIGGELSLLLAQAS